jgi:hypothetical protein
MEIALFLFLNCNVFKFIVQFTMSQVYFFTTQLVLDKCLILSYHACGSFYLQCWHRTKAWVFNSNYWHWQKLISNKLLCYLSYTLILKIITATKIFSNYS